MENLANDNDDSRSSKSYKRSTEESSFNLTKSEASPSQLKKEINTKKKDEI